MVDHEIIIECRAEHNAAVLNYFRSERCEDSSAGTVRTRFLILTVTDPELLRFRMVGRFGINDRAGMKTEATVDTFLQIGRRIPKALTVCFHFDALFRTYFRAGSATAARSLIVDPDRSFAPYAFV